MISKNPFIFKEVPLSAPFCNRQKELKELTAYAEGGGNVVLFSPRRFGKTSLVRRVQQKLSDEGFTTIFADFFGVTSVEEAASRLARAIFEVTQPKKSLFQTAIQIIKSFRPVLKPDEEGRISLTVEYVSSQKKGLDVLEETLASLGLFAKEVDDRLNVVLDEFQEITEVKECLQMEAVMRTHIQRHPFSYFFVGSRRRILLGIFNDRKRPFFQSAINYELKALPEDELISFIAEMFGRGGKNCPENIAELISMKISRHPYYAQKLSFFIFELSDETIQKKNVIDGFEYLLDSEKQTFEAILQGLASKQISLLKAIASESSPSIFSMEYMRHHHLGSTGGVQGATKRLTALDLVEKNADNYFQVVDPVFKVWLCKT